MKREQFAPPAPEVQHLPTLLRRVQAGEIRVPAFQREYIWEEKQIIELLESVYNGYPIGSLLFWQPISTAIAIKEDSEFPIPQSSTKQPATYILDGQQRLATIYNCFFYKETSIPDRFNVTFDLRKQSFQHYRKGDSESGRLHLGSLFVPRAFLSVQQTLAQEKDAEVLLDSSIALHAAFQDYMIPIVNIKGRDTGDVVQVFERINNTGVRLSAVDFMRAVTWSDDFDLYKETSKLRRSAEASGFSIPSETLVKVMAISQGLDPIPSSMLKLRELSAPALHKAAQLVSRAMTGAVDFLQKHLHMYTYEYVPYEAQMLVIAKLFLASNLKPTPSSLKTIERWFLRTSIAEELQGKADSVISNLVRSIDALVEGETRPFEGRLEIDPEELTTRKFIVKRAISSALAILFAERGACSILTGKVLPPEEYMDEFAAGHFVPILGGDEVNEAAHRSEKRTFANMLLVSEDDRRTLRRASAAEILLTRPPSDIVLQSQLISKQAMSALRNSKNAQFLTLRAKEIVRGLQELVDA